MKTKLFILGGIALALSSCSDDIISSGEVGNNGPALSTETGLQTASYIVGQALQTRAQTIDTWSNGVHSNPCGWENKLEFQFPEGAIDVTKAEYWDQWGNYYGPTGNVYYVPKSFEGELNLNYRISLNDGDALYNYGTITAINNVNYNGKVTFYNAGTLTYAISSGQRHTVVNTGTLNVVHYANIGEVYNGGVLVLKGSVSYEYPDWNNYQPVEVTKADIPNEMSIYSNGGEVYIPNDGDFKAAADIHNTLYVDGNVKIQNSETQYICGLEVEGTLDVTQGNLQTSYIKADEIKFDGASIYLLPEAHIVANKISLPNSASTIVGYEGSYALVEATDFYFRNKNNFESAFSSNIYFKVDGSIEIEEILVRDNGQQDNVYSQYANAADYLASQNGQALADRINAGDISGNPECGDSYGSQQPEEPTGPKLIPVGSIESPNHDHNADKPEYRKLSATSIDYKDGIFYTSYHMRGGNYANDQYDKDYDDDENDVEGCIEAWTLKANEEGQKELTLGQYAWTYEFDFNHIIIDGGDIITVGHKENKGAIIAKLPNTFEDFDPNYEGTWTSNDLKYKYLTTDVAVYGDYTNENQNSENTVTNQLIDYKNAGDGNGVIRVGDEYFVATYEGYGKVKAEDFSRVKDDEGNVAFVTTPGSAKYLINKGESDVAVLYLDSRPETTATAQSTATVATTSRTAFPFGAKTESLQSYVQPIDGKNVIAWDGSNLYACLGKGGLAIGNEVINFGENEAEPVNGVAVDNEYIYVATGSHLRVLDINTKAEVANYGIPYMSANFIKVIEQDGEKYIVVAFGQEGIKVFRLQK